MGEALKAARIAGGMGEVPVGACIVAPDGFVVALAGNRTRADCDPTAHAEVVALRVASQRAGNYRLTDLTLYSTIEPCAMCAGAMIQARLRRLVYGAHDERAGAVESVFQILDSNLLNHRIEVRKGILEAECRALLQDFFRARR